MKSTELDGERVTIDTGRVAKKPSTAPPSVDPASARHQSASPTNGTHHAAPHDRRVQRTYRSLREALYALIRERGWEAVHVQDICERANVGRSTFYAHFADKEDLLVSGFGDLAASLHAHARAHRDSQLPFARPLLEHARDHWWIVANIGDRNSGQLVRERLIDVVAECMLEDVPSLPRAHPRREAVARYVAGAFIELFRWWMEPRNQRTPVDDVLAIFERMSIAALRDV